jgi:hypothetical protein
LTPQPLIRFRTAVRHTDCWAATATRVSSIQRGWAFDSANASRVFRLQVSFIVCSRKQPVFLNLKGVCLQSWEIFAACAEFVHTLFWTLRGFGAMTDLKAGA